MDKPLKSACLMVCLLLLLPLSSLAHHSYAYRMCQKPGFYCVTVKSGQHWHTLFRDPGERNIVKRLNRMNIPLRSGMKIAVPRNLYAVTLSDIAPFPAYRAASNKKTIIVSQRELAWGAYDRDGRLVRWGPISGGKSYCPDVGRSCRTAVGHFMMYTKRGAN